MKTFIILLFGAGVTTNALAGDCEPTQAMFMGTHYKPIERFAVDVSKGLVVAGRVLDAHTCQPISGARIEHWQAGSEGVYVDRLRAYLTSDDRGAYRFETEWPAAAVPHIHFRIVADGYHTLSTQWAGDDPVQRIDLDLVLQAK